MNSPESSIPVPSPAILRAVVESAPTAMVMIDALGRIVLVNAETESLFGYPRTELLGKSVEILVPQRFRDAHPGYRASYYQEPTARPMGAGRDLYGRKRDGSEFPIEIGLNPIKTEDDLFILSAIVDISERKRLEERFRATQQGNGTAVRIRHRRIAEPACGNPRASEVPRWARDTP